MLGFFTCPARGGGDVLLAELAHTLLAQGARLAGAIQHNVETSGQIRCDMTLEILGQGNEIRISQRLGAGARGCRLDPAGLEQTVGLVEATLSAPRDLLIINKFGKQEIDGRGFRPVIARALSQDVPVLISVPEAHRGAFAAFAGDLAQEVPARITALHAWYQQARS